MLKLRLRRVGRKHDPSFRVVITEATSPPKGKYLEAVGFYNARLKQLNLDKDRIKHWLSVGVQPTDTVHNLLIKEGVIDGKKIAVHSNKPKKKKEEEESSAGETKEVSKEKEVKDSSKESKDTNKEAEVPKEEKSETKPDDLGKISADDSDNKTEEIPKEEAETPKEENTENVKDEKQEEAIDPVRGHEGTQRASASNGVDKSEKKE